MAAAKEENRELAEAPITGLLLKLAIPTVIAQLVNLLYNMVDRIYVGRIPEVGTEALAGHRRCPAWEVHHGQPSQWGKESMRKQRNIWGMRRLC